MLIRFDRMYEHVKHTDRHTYTDRHTDGHRMMTKAALDASIARQKHLLVKAITCALCYNLHV